MISKELYKEIAGKWDELRDEDGDKLRIYQKYERLETRYPIFLQHVNLFKDKHVLEIGANAGMAAMQIAKVAKQYTGVELASGYHQQSLVTRTYIENPNVCFNKCSVKSYIKRLLKGKIKDKPNACYMSYVLYHFENKEVEMFKEHILPLLDIIIVQSRFAKRNIKGRTKHNDYGFWHHDNVTKYLQSAGFETQLIWHENKKFHFIIGTRKKESGVEFAKNTEKGIMSLSKIEIPQAFADSFFSADKLPEMPITKTMKGLQDADTRDSGVHTESKSTRPSGWGSCERQGRPVEGESQLHVKRETSPSRQSKTLLAKERRNRPSSVLQSGMEDGAKVAVRKENVSETEQTSFPRINAASEENSQS